MSDRDRLFGVAPGPPPPQVERRLEQLHDAIREVRAGKTPGSWTEAERRLFALLPEGKGS